MTNQTRHFVLTDGDIREFSGEQAARVAAGAGTVPELADRWVRYLQVTVMSEPDEDIKVVTTGARIHFDAKGRLSEAGPIGEKTEPISNFEHDACVQLALRDLPAPVVTYH